MILDDKLLQIQQRLDGSLESSRTLEILVGIDIIGLASDTYFLIS